MNRKGARYVTYTDDVMTLVKRRAKLNLGDLKQEYLARRAQLKGKILSRCNVELKFGDVIEELGMKATKMLIKIVKENYHDDIQHTVIHMNLTLVVSGFVSGGFIPSFEDVEVLDGELLIRYNEPTRKVSQRAVSCRNFYGTGQQRKDFVLIDFDSSNSGRDKRYVWVRKILGLFHLHWFNANTEEVAFVQYFDVIENDDDLMKELGCVHMKWARENEPEKIPETTGKWFDVIPVSAIRGTVHVVSIDHEIRKISEPKLWYDQIFHFKCFYSKSNEIED